jgi:hypothetical protein
MIHPILSVESKNINIFTSLENSIWNIHINIPNNNNINKLAFKVYIRINISGNFCIVKNQMKIVVDNELSIIGIHEWNGAAPTISIVIIDDILKLYIIRIRNNILHISW